jgi:hypothetical protein
MIRRETRNSGKLGNGEKPVLLNEVEPGQRARRQRAKPRHGAPLAGTSVPRPRPFPSPPSRLTSTVFGLSLGNCKAYIPRRAGGGRIVGRMRGHTRAPVFLPATAKGGGPDPPAWCRRFTKAQSLLSLSYLYHNGSRIIPACFVFASFGKSPMPQPPSPPPYVQDHAQSAPSPRLRCNRVPIRDNNRLIFRLDIDGLDVWL